MNKTQRDKPDDNSEIFLVWQYFVSFPFDRLYVCKCASVCLCLWWFDCVWVLERIFVYIQLSMCAADDIFVEYFGFVFDSITNRKWIFDRNNTPNKTKKKCSDNSCTNEEIICESNSNRKRECKLQFLQFRFRLIKIALNEIKTILFSQASPPINLVLQNVM